MTTALHPPSLPRKLATLLFSGGLAVLAVTRAGLASCDVAAPPRRDITPSDEQFTTPQPHTPAPHVIPEELPDDYFGGAKSDAEAWPAPPKPAIAIVPPEAPIAPPPRPGAWFHLYTLTRRLAEPPPSPELPPRYFGGAKSDPDAWAGDWADLPGPNGSESYNEFTERTGAKRGDK